MRHLLVSFVLFLLFCCGVQAQPACEPVVTISGDITANRTLDRDSVYEIDNCVNVTNNATLTIEDGCIIQFAANSILMIREDGFINAVGLAGNPIVMTAAADDPGNRTVVSNAGLVIVGEAPINIGSTLALPCSETLTVGNSPTDNSGTIQYLQIHYLGGISTNSFGAGLTLAGVGSGTTLENIQVTNSGLTGINIIGGAPVLTEIITQDNAENGLFVSFGAQVVLEGYLENRNSIIAHHANGSWGIKLQNNISNPAATPVTNFQMTNGSILGPKYCYNSSVDADFKDGILVDNNASATILNSVIAGWPGNGLFISGVDCIAKTGSNDVNCSYTSFYANTTNFDASPSSTSPSWGANGGCNTTMLNWLTSTGFGCEETGIQLSTSFLGYDNSFCDDYCDPEFTANFVLTESTTLAAADPLTSIYDERGAVQFDDLFGWINICPQDALYCADAFKNDVQRQYVRFTPNPAHMATTANFEAKSTGIATITLLDPITGAPLRSFNSSITQTGEQEVSISVGGLKEGVYTLRVQLHAQILYGQLVVK